jgi:hypothetical protein
VWLLLSSSLLHTIALVEVAARRPSVARWYQSLCGDVLLSGGCFDGARRCYEAALSPRTDRGPGLDGAPWGGLNYWLYRKLIVCAAACGDPTTLNRCDAERAMSDIGAGIISNTAASLLPVAPGVPNESDSDDEGDAWGFEAVSGERNDERPPPRDAAPGRQTGTNPSTPDRTCPAAGVGAGVGAGVSVALRGESNRLYASCRFVRVVPLSTTGTDDSASASSRYRVVVQTHLHHGRDSANGRDCLILGAGDGDVALELCGCSVACSFFSSDDCERDDAEVAAGISTIVEDSVGSSGAQFVAGKQLLPGQRIFCAFQIAVQIGASFQLATRKGQEQGPGPVALVVELRFRYRLLPQGKVNQPLPPALIGMREEVLCVKCPIAELTPSPRTTLPVGNRREARVSQSCNPESSQPSDTSTSTRIFTTAFSVSDRQRMDSF